jgi:CBS domain-containing protein
MEPSQTEIESLIIELAEKSFKTFCGDISGMFGMDMTCNRQEVTYETVNGLQSRFESFAVVYSVKAESAKGGLDGTFQMVFDREGLFILAGVVAMQPGQMILEDIKSCLLEKAEKASNVLNEVGTALAGSWDRVFHKELDEHGRFALTNTFIGNPWDKAEEKIGLNSDEELVFVPYDMTLGPYPSFKCGAIFPKSIFTGTSDSDTEQPAPAEETSQEGTEGTAELEESEVAEKAQPEAEVQEDAEGTAESEESAAADQVQPEAEAQEDTEGTAESEENAAADQAQPEAEGQEDTEGIAEPEENAATDQEQPEAEAQEDTEGTAEPEESEVADQAQPEAEETVAADESTSEQVSETTAEQNPNDVEEEATTPAETDSGQERPISEAIKQLTQSAAVSSYESIPSTMDEKPSINKEALLAVFAKDIMQKDVVWGNPDDSVQQALSKIQQHNVGYIMIGKEQVPEGIISKSDLTGALSPYLRNIFAKWRRPMDDATLQIKIKWIMSKPTCTISPETSLAKIMENMCQMDKKCLPVVDDQGKVQGLVTVFDIFRALLKHSCPK